MRVTVLSGGKRSTISGGRTGSGYRIIRTNRGGGVYEPLKVHIIKPSGRVERGELRLEMGTLKRTSRPLRPIERALRKLVRAEQKALGRFLILHERSRRRERNGWATDLGSNLVKVIRR
jgi:hypothetical protein